MLKKIILSTFFFMILSSGYAISAEKPRWVGMPIYVYIPEYGNYTKLMQRAFLEWEKYSNDLIRFKFINKPSSANIHVHFVKQVKNCNSEFAVGCERTLHRGGQFYKSDIEIATRKLNSNNEFRPIKNIYGVMLHEIGHSLGLGHSNNPKSIM